MTTDREAELIRFILALAEKMCVMAETITRLIETRKK